MFCGINVAPFLLEAATQGAEAEPDPFAGVTEPEPIAKPPEKPKCEALDEGCKAEADTWVEVGEGAKFQPAKGWNYAKLEGVSVALAEGNAAGIAYRIVSAPLTPKKDAAGVIDALGPVFAALSAEVSDKAIRKQLKKKRRDRRQGGACVEHVAAGG